MNKKVNLLTTFIMLLAITFGNYMTASAQPAKATKSAAVVINGSSFPCSTFKECASLLSPGATLQVSGEWAETLEVLASGTSAKPINIVGSGALLNLAEHSGIIIRGDYVNVSGFEITGPQAFGLYVSGRYGVMQNNVIHNSVTANGTNGSCGTSGGSFGSGLKLALGAENVIVRNNTVYENCGEGITLTRAVGTLVEGNNVRDNYSMNIYVDNSPYTTVQNNTSTCTGIYLRNGERAMGVGLGEESYSGWGSQRHDIQVLNNTISGCSYGVGVMSSNVGGTFKDSVISGNIITGGTTRSISLLSHNQNILISNNQIYADLYLRYPDGVTLLNNTIIDSSSTFGDVPTTYWAYPYIESLYNAGITSGCSTSPLLYCPSSTVTRAQMAVFLLRGIHGSSYTPPSASGAVFGDVPASTFAAAWIEQLASEGITSGCGSGNYCPDATVTRAQMAIFLLRSEHGSAYVPPTATGVFPDVPVGSFAADWIEQLASEGITSGCGGGNFCPNTSVTRDQMAVFLVKAFNLP